MGLFSKFSGKKNKEETFTCFICKREVPSSKKSGFIGTNIACKDCGSKFMALSFLQILMNEKKEPTIKDLGYCERLWNAKNNDDPKIMDREGRKLYERQFEKLGIKAQEKVRPDSDPENAVVYNSLELNNERNPVVKFNCQNCGQEVIIEGTNPVPIDMHLLVYFMSIPRIKSYSCTYCNYKNKVYKWVY